MTRIITTRQEMTQLLESMKRGDVTIEEAQKRIEATWTAIRLQYAEWLELKAKEARREIPGN